MGIDCRNAPGVSRFDSWVPVSVSFRELGLFKFLTEVPCFVLDERIWGQIGSRTSSLYIDKVLVPYFERRRYLTHVVVFCSDTTLGNNNLEVPPFIDLSKRDKSWFSMI